MSTVLGPQDRAGDASSGTGIVLFEPGGLEEHDFGDILHLSGDDDVSLDGDDVACDGNIAKLVLGSPFDNLALVVSEDEFVEEFVRAELHCGLEDDGFSRDTQPPVVPPVNEVVLQNVESDTNGDRAQVVHEASGIVVGYHHRDTCCFEIHGEHGGGGHFCLLRLAESIFLVQRIG